MRLSFSSLPSLCFNEKHFFTVPSISSFLQRLIQNIFWQTGTYLELPKASSPWLAQSTKILKIFPPDAQKIHSMALSVFRFLCQLFSKLFSSSWMIFKELMIFDIFINKFCMAINLCELQSDLNWKDAASSTEGITRSSVNYLCHLMTWSKFVKKSRKSEHFHELLCRKTLS